MLYALFNGMGTGVVLSLMLGTVFFALIQNSIQNGYKSGILIAAGVVFSDAIFISFAVFGTRLLPRIENFDMYASIVGGFLLLTMGLSSLIKKSPQITYPKTRFGNLLYFFSTGFLLNILNPFNFFSWVTISTYLNAMLGYSIVQDVLFFAGCLLSIFLTEVLLSVFAFRLKAYFTPLILSCINKVSGAAFVVFGLRMLWTVMR